MRDYDDWKLDTPDNHVEVHCVCDHCGQFIYKGELYKYIPMYSDRVHEDCLSDYLLDRIDVEDEVAE
jgi:hypothetical protein